MTRRRALRFFGFERRLVYAAMLLYALGAHVIIPANLKTWREIPPFFDWSLFPSAFPDQTVMQLHLERSKDSGPKQTCPLQECAFVDRRILNKNFFFVLQKCGASVKNGNTLCLQNIESRLRRSVEAPFSYEIRETLVNVEQYVRSGTVLKHQVVHSASVAQ